MILIWKLREWLKTERGVKEGVEVSRIIRQRTGHIISPQAVCELFNDPKMLRVETMKALCEAFDCRLSDFCEVLSTGASRRHAKRAQAIEPPIECKAIASPKPAAGCIKPKQPYASWTDYSAYFPDARNFSARPATD